MADTIEYTDTFGISHVISNVDLSYGLKVVVDDKEKEWDFTTSDPVNLPLTTQHVGGRPNTRH